MKMILRKLPVAAMLLGTLALASCSDKDNNGNDGDDLIPGGKGTMEVLDPEECKEYISDAAVKALDLLDPADQEDLLDLAVYFEDNLSGFELPDNFYGNDDESSYYSPAHFISPLRKLRNGDLDAVTRATATYTYDVNFEQYTGVYEANTSRREWVRTGNSKDIVFKFTDNLNKKCELKVVRSGGNSEYSYEEESDDYWNDERYIYNILIPNTVTATLTRGGTVLAESTVNSNFDVKGKNANADINAQLANITIVGNLNADNNQVTLSSSAKVSGTSLLSMKVQVNGNHLCDIEYLDGAEDITKIIKDGVAAVDLMGKVQVYGDLTLNSKVVAALDAYIDSNDGYTESQAKKAIQKECDTLNDNIKVKLCLDGTSTEQAGGLFEPYVYSYDSSYYSFWEVYPEMVVAYPDGSTVSFGEYASGFMNVRNKANTLISTYNKFINNLRKKQNK